MKIICSVRCLWFLWCVDLVCNWLHHNKHSRHILGVHANMITAVRLIDHSQHGNDKKNLLGDYAFMRPKLILFVLICRKKKKRSIS